MKFSYWPLAAMMKSIDLLQATALLGCFLPGQVNNFQLDEKDIV